MKKKKMKTLDRVILVLFISLALFIVAMIVLFCIYQSIPDTLVQYVLGASGIELILTAWITTTKTKYKPHNTQTEDDTPPQEDPDGQADDY